MKCLIAAGNKKALFPGPICEAGERARTVDPQLGKLMLYQLSYARVGTVILPAASRVFPLRPQPRTGIEYDVFPSRGMKSHRPAVS
jgi:hypothetical protein